MNQNGLPAKAHPPDLVWAEVPYSTSHGSKIRPFLIWRDFRVDFWGFPLTSRPPRYVHELALADWQIAQLSGPSTVRVGSGCPISKELVRGIIGTISPCDADKVAQLFIALFVEAEPLSDLDKTLNLEFA